MLEGNSDEHAPGNSGNTPSIVDLAAESLSYGRFLSSMLSYWPLVVEYDQGRNIPHGFGYGLDCGLWLP
jgi:hypothetical protein